jgi:AraC-like DNA-binding protein
MTKLRERFAGRPVMHTSDLEEATSGVERFFLPHSVDVMGPAAELDVQLNALQLRSVTVGYLRYGPEVRMLTAEASHYHVNIPLAGATESRSGRRERVVSTPQRSAIFMPDAPAEIRWSPGSAQLCIMLARSTVDRELEKLLGHPLTGPLEFDVSMDLTADGATAWLSALDLLEQEAGRASGVLQFPVAAAHLEALLIHGLLLTQPHNYSDELLGRATAPRPRAVRGAVELLEERPEHPWTVAELAAAVAVSARTLQGGFARAFGKSPMAYLRDVRLDRIHAELLAAEPGVLAVGAAAARWGFLHAGRFSLAYKRRFGRSPSETVRRS